MPDPTPPRIGAFTSGTARLAKHGAAQYGNDGKIQSITDTWIVYLADPRARLILANIADLPRVGSAHALSDELELTGYRVADHEPGQLFREIECIYEADGETESEGSGGEQQEIGRVTALDWPAYTASGDIVADQETGAPVLNSAGDVFDSVPQFEQTWHGVHFVRRVKTFPSAILALAGTVNSATTKIYGVSFRKRTARLRVGCRYLFDGSERPYELDITVEPRHNIVDTTAVNLRPSGVSGNYDQQEAGKVDIGWDVGIVDCGYQYLSNGTLIRFTVTDENGGTSAPQLPQLLTESGDDGRTASHKSMLIVRTAKGSTWDALKAPDKAPGETTSP